jgi:predicted ATPase
MRDVSLGAERSDLRGRASECAALDDLVADVRGGRSRALVLRGEAGIGKTALLRYLEDAACGLVVLCAVGVDSEMELAYASLHQLCLPLLGQLERLPGPQREALRIVFGLSAGPPPNQFLVGLTVLGLLSGAAESSPVVCIVDDAQWLDKASVLTLAFVARRLMADPVGMVFAAREMGAELQQIAVLAGPDDGAGRDSNPR